MKAAETPGKGRGSTAARVSMRALRFDGTSPKLVNAQPRPEPADGEALIRTRRAAVSGIEIELCRSMLNFKGTLGHEFVGVVESINGDEHPQLVGRLVVGSVAAVFGQCDMVQTGLRYHCLTRTCPGTIGRVGCLAARSLPPCDWARWFVGGAQPSSKGLTPAAPLVGQGGSDEKR